MSQDQAKQMNPDGSLTFSAGNIAANIINRDFIKKIVEVEVGPYTAAFKKIAHHHEEKGFIKEISDELHELKSQNNLLNK